ncbi:MAG: DUF1636 family protein [Gammaproteobacteria bacterium]
MQHRLYVCVTCVRDLPKRFGGPPGQSGRDVQTRGHALAAAVEAALTRAGPPPGLNFIRVPCLNGCLKPCNIALRARGKFNLRFSRVQPQDAGDVVALARAYMTSESGDIPPSDQPDTLRGKQSARLPPPHLLLAQAGVD